MRFERVFEAAGACANPINDLDERYGVQVTEQLTFSVIADLHYLCLHRSTKRHLVSKVTLRHSFDRSVGLGALRSTPATGPQRVRGNELSNLAAHSCADYIRCAEVNAGVDSRLDYLLDSFAERVLLAGDAGERYRDGHTRIVFENRLED